MASAARGRRMMHGTEHKIDKDLHDPAMLAQAGRDAGRVDAAGAVRLRDHGVRVHPPERRRPGARLGDRADLAQERTEPIHKELVAALGDKDRQCARRRRRRWPTTTTSHVDGDLCAVCGQEVAGAADRGGGVPAHDGSPGAVASEGCARGASRTVADNVRRAMDFLRQYKNALFLIAVLLVQAIALAVQVRTPVDPGASRTGAACA